MSAYTDFVKANYHKVKHLPQKQRFAELGKMWRQHSGGKKAKGGVMSGAGMDEHGAGFLSSALGAFGLGLPQKKTRARKAKGGVMSGAGMDEHMDEHGAGFLSSALGAIGLGLDQKKLH